MREIMDVILRFREERNWEQFHTDTNLAKSICIEAGELLELVQWNNNVDLEHLKEETADVFTYALFLTHHYGFSVLEIVKDKMQRNALKYPKVKEYILKEETPIEYIRQYVFERGWEKTDSIELLAISLLVESGELLANYEWNKSKFDLVNVSHELADIFTILFSICDTYNWDYKDIILSKMEKNRKKYPVEKAYGKSDKYNKL